MAAETRRSRSWARSPTPRPRRSRPTSTSGARPAASRSSTTATPTSRRPSSRGSTAGNPPDIAIYPQPGVLKSQTNTLFPLEDLGIDVDAITSDEANGLGDDREGRRQDLRPAVLDQREVARLVQPGRLQKAAATRCRRPTPRLTALQEKIMSTDSGYPWCVGHRVRCGDGLARHRLARGVRPALRRSRPVQRAGSRTT